LLEQWAAEKLNFAGAHVDHDYLDIPGPGMQTPVEVKREWDRLVDVDIDHDDCFRSVHGMEFNGHSCQHVKQAKKNSGRNTLIVLSVS